MSRRAWALALASAAISLGCGSSPEPVYYAMSTTAGPAQPGWARIVKLRQPALAGYLDRAEIVRRVVHYRLRVASGESWGEPLGDMFARILAQDLAQRLPGSSVFTEGSAIATTPDAVVAIDVQRFDVGQDDELTLQAQVDVERGRDDVAVASRSLSLSIPRAGGTTASLVAGMSVLVGRLADPIAQLLREDPAATGDTAHFSH
jgi:uncharacterized lipoprotein YmbA